MTKIKRLLDLQHKVFGQLTVIETIYSETHKHDVWKCLCSCGNYTNVPSTALVHNRTRSCGCLSKNVRHLCKRSHGQNGTLLYKRWLSMRGRCKPNAKCSKWYHERGITICPRWEKFENFKQDMEVSFKEHLEKFGAKQTTLERVNTNDGYKPENCKWATFKEQHCNQRKGIVIKNLKTLNNFLKEINKVKGTDISLTEEEYLTLSYNFRLNN